MRSAALTLYIRLQLTRGEPGDRKGTLDATSPPVVSSTGSANGLWHGGQVGSGHVRTAPDAVQTDCLLQMPTEASGTGHPFFYRKKKTHITNGGRVPQEALQSLYNIGNCSTCSRQETTTH